MAINVIQQPAAVSFSGDPIIAKAKTTLVGKTFLRITLQCDVTIIRAGNLFKYEEKLTYPISDDGLATFNVGSIIQTGFDKYTFQEVYEQKVNQILYYARYNLTYKEIYLNGIYEEEGTTVISEVYTSIMGRLTEYERMSMDGSDTTLIIGDGRILSRKPEEEMVAKGIDLYIPAVSSSGELKFSVIQGDSKKDSIRYTAGTYVPDSLRIETGNLLEGGLKIDINAESGKGKIIVQENSSMRHFLFLNGFGLIESITATMRESLKYTIDSEHYIIPSDINFKGYTRIISYTQTPKIELEMSSGYVNRKWAEWWINEFVPTRKAWMLLGDKYIPVAIIPEESNKLFDKSKPGMMAVQFKVRYSFSGGTYNSFIK